MKKLILIEDNENNIPEINGGDIYINNKNEFIYVINMIMYYDLKLIKFVNGKVKISNAKTEDLIDCKFIINIWKDYEQLNKIYKEIYDLKINFWEYLKIRYANTGRGNI